MESLLNQIIDMIMRLDSSKTNRNDKVKDLLENFKISFTYINNKAIELSNQIKIIIDK